MPTVIRVILATATCVLTHEASAACYTIYKNDLAIYQSSIAPIDMGLPFSQTVPAKFGQGATLVFQEWVNLCAEFDGSAGVDKSSASTQQSQGQVSNSGSSSGRPVAVSRSPQLPATPIASSDLVINSIGNYGNSSGIGSSSGHPGLIQTGPRGGQYYVNSNNNKTYISSGSSGRSDRR